MLTSSLLGQPQHRACCLQRETGLQRHWQWLQTATSPQNPNAISLMVRAGLIRRCHSPGPTDQGHSSLQLLTVHILAPESLTGSGLFFLFGVVLENEPRAFARTTSLILVSFRCLLPCLVSCCLTLGVGEWEEELNEKPLDCPLITRLGNQTRQHIPRDIVPQDRNCYHWTLGGLLEATHSHLHVLS